MDKNQEIFEKARYLGIPVYGDSSEEKLQNIGNHIGLPNFTNPSELSSKLDDLYNNQINHSNNMFQKDNKSSIAKINPKNDSIHKHSKMPPKINLFNYSNIGKNFSNNLKQKKEQNKQNSNLYNQYFSSKIKQHSVENDQKSSKNIGFFRNVKSIQNPKKILQGSESIPFLSINVKMKVAVISGIAIAISLIIVMILAVIITDSTLEVDESELNNNPNIKDYLTGNIEFEQFTDTLVYMNLCSSETDKDKEVENCLNSPAGIYFSHIRDLYSNYSNYSDINGNPIKLDVNLIIETISYNISDLELFNENNLNNILSQADSLAEAQVEKYQEVGDLYYKNNKSSNCLVKNDQVVKSSDGSSFYYRISDDKYISYLKYGEVHENYSGDIKVYDVDIHPDSDSSCIPSGRMYQSSDVVRYTSGTIDTNTDNPTDNPSEIIQTNIKTQEITIPISGLAKSYKIAWVSDLHLIASADRNNSDTAKQRYENDFYTSGTHADEWLPQIVSYLNNGNFDAVIFGGDMVDQGTTEAIKLFKQYYNQVNISNKIYVRADHDYLSDLYGEAGDQSSVTATSEIYSFSLGNVLFLGIDYSNKDLSESAYNELVSQIDSASNVVIATHVPYESTVSTTLKEYSLSIRNRLYYWQSEDSSASYYYSSDSNTKMNQFLNNYIYNDSKVKYVLAGHMHGAWSGSISSNGLKEQIFNPAFNGYVGVINLVPN